MNNINDKIQEAIKRIEEETEFKAYEDEAGDPGFQIDVPFDKNWDDYNYSLTVTEKDGKEVYDVSCTSSTEYFDDFDEAVDYIIESLNFEA